MKKLIAIFLVFILLLIPAALADDVPGPPVAGDWYAELDDIPLHLSLNADGTYSLVFPDEPGGSLEGTWATDDIFVRLEDGSILTLVSEDLLIWQGKGLRFTREAPRAYVPADLLPDAALGIYAGYWKCAFVDRGDATVPAKAVDDHTDLYIEDTLVALGGPRFGDIFRDFGFADGVLFADVNGQAVTLDLQQDAYLRLTVGEETLYLARVITEAPDGEVE
ncbi:MAG: hypothetical protein IJJ45_02480 [Clostridia bacterium]|nr:hypothetical protein [Clostridia bacterium]